MFLACQASQTYPFSFEGGGGAFRFFLPADVGGAAVAIVDGGGGGITLLWSPNREEELLTMGLRDLSSSPSDPLLTLLSPALWRKWKESSSYRNTSLINAVLFNSNLNSCC